MSSKILSRALGISKFNKLTSKQYLSSLNVAKEKRIKVGKYNINYLKVGSGPNHLLCTPGTFGTIWSDFKYQVIGIDGDKFTLIVWDPPGHGKSRPPEKEFDLDYFERDADYSYQFMKALNIERYSLLGWSAGGTSGMIHAAKYPDTVQKLVVWGTASIIGPGDFENFKKMRNLNNWSKSYLNEIIDMYGKENFTKQVSIWINEVIEIYTKRNGNLCFDFLPSIKCPTFILHGERDAFIDKENLLHLHANIVGSRFYLYPGGNHNIHIKFAEDFNKRVQEFLLE